MIVIDASITLSWFFADEDLPERRAVLKQVLDEGAVAPHHWRMESANVLVVGKRRKRLDEAGFLASLTEILDLPVEVEDSSAGTVRAAVHFAEQYRLTAYDAAYLELALRRQLPLATLDRQLAAAARAAGVTTLP